MKLFVHQHFDLCLLDWATGLTGLELTQRIRTFDERVPILFYSGVAGEEEQKKALDAGAQGYLIKPDGIGNLTEEIDRLIQQRLGNSLRKI